MLNALIDKLQAAFPPNRIAVYLTPLVFVPVAASVSAWVTAHFPGVDLSEGAVVGFAGAGALAALTLAYKWLDQWQRGEQINAEADVDAAIDALAEDDPAIGHALAAFGTLEGVAGSVTELRARVESEDGPNEEQIGISLASIADSIAGFLHEYEIEQVPVVPASDVPTQ